MGERESTQQEANALIRNEHQYCESSVIDMTKLVEKVPECCIYQVPYPFRRMYEEIYSPRVISIGPFHHGNEKLKTMEKYKVKYLEAFIIRAEINMEDLKHFVEDFEESIRQCYEEPILFTSDDFVTMILTDASFIIELFLRNKFTQWTPEDRIAIKPWLATKMQLDLILLENQLPFSIVDKLFERAFASRPVTNSMVELSFEYFQNYNTQKMFLDPELKILHFSDLLRNFYLPPRRRLPNRKLKKVEHMYSATQLDGVGLKFEVDLSSNCLLDLDLHLDYKKRVLKIPRFTFDNDTMIHVPNLLALEQCHYPNDTYVTDHFILLDFLINREEDLDLLHRQRIVVNRFSNGHATNYFINNLSTGITHSTMSTKYYDICIKLKIFYENPSWPEYIRRTCFSTLLRMAALTVTILTLIQTVCSLISVIPHH